MVQIALHRITTHIQYRVYELFWYKTKYSFYQVELLATSRRLLLEISSLDHIRSILKLIFYMKRKKSGCFKRLGNFRLFKELLETETLIFVENCRLFMRFDYSKS